MSPLEHVALSSARFSPFGFLTAGVSAIVLLSAAVAIVAGMVASPPPYFMLGFEIVIALACVFGVLVGLGRFGSGPAIALVCVAGTIGVGSLLGYLGAGRRLGGVDLTPFLFGRGAAAGSIAMIAAVMVLKRDARRSVPALVRGLAFAGALAGFLGAVYWIRPQVFAYGPLAKAALVIVSGIVGLALLAAAVHYTIKAFEHGKFSNDAVRM